MTTITRLKDVLEKVLEGNLGMPRAMDEHRITLSWGKVNERAVTENTAPDKFVDGILYVNVKNSTWGQQINLIKPNIISKLNSELGDSIVKDIKVRAGSISRKGLEEPAKVKKVCGICSAEHSGSEDICPVCFRKAGHDKNVRLLRFINTNPDAVFSAAREYLPGATEAEFHRAKRELTAKKTDAKNMERRQRGYKTKN